VADRERTGTVARIEALDQGANAAPTVEVSLMMSCLTEADTPATCIEKIHRALPDPDISREVIVADNGNTDGSQAIATRMGARLVHVAERGYGSALRGRIDAARGRFVIAHPLLFASLASLLGYQPLLCALFTRRFAITEGLLPEDSLLASLFQVITLERGLIIAVAALIFGFGLFLAVVEIWRAVHFGHLDYAHTMRFVVPRATLSALGFQPILSSFFVCMLGLRRR
jgi:glycosyltransferase involved in cell wall biosynthesis